VATVNKLNTFSELLYSGAINTDQLSQCLQQQSTKLGISPIGTVEILLRFQSVKLTRIMKADRAFSGPGLLDWIGFKLCDR